jgi:hypothetical protein
VPEMKNLDDFEAFLDAVVDQNWRVHKLTDAGATVNRTADVRESPQKINVVEKGVAEAFSGSREVGPGVFEDALEIG